MRNALLIQIIALGCCVSLLFGASRLIPTINTTRNDLNILGSASDLENAPPEYAFAIQAFGAFRSLITDIAFIRADEYKNRGRYYDAMQLAAWICQLQPYFPTVWEFHAWNMTWNISVTTHTAEERWHWVYNGVKLLRDEGIPYNPRAVNLYKQLAWTFNNKMGGYVDEYHFAYKCEWAWRMHLLLGPPPRPDETTDPNLLERLIHSDVRDDPLFRAAERQRQIDLGRRADDEVNINQLPVDEELADPEDVLLPQQDSEARMRAEAASIQRYREIAEAPQTLDALYAATPAARDLVRQLWDLGVRISDDELDEERYWNKDGLSQKFFLPYRRLADPSWLHQMKIDAAEQARLDRFDEIVGVTTESPTGKALLRFLQGKVLREVYKNDPAELLIMVEQFGPIDMRLVDAQAIYWARRGLIRSEGTEADFFNDKMNLTRILFFSLQSLARSNKLFFEPAPDRVYASYYNPTPDPRFIETMHEAYMVYAKRFSQMRNLGAGAGSMFRSGHINFLSEGIRVLYFAGRREKAQELYDVLRDLYGVREGETELEPRYRQNLREYVVSTFKENKMLRREAIAFINGMIFNAMQQMMAGDSDGAAGFLEQARLFHAFFGEDKIEHALKRNRLPDFQYMFADAVLTFMMQPTAHDVHTLQKARLFQVLPISMQRMVYDFVLPKVTDECRAYDLELASLFPEPPGMETFRKENHALEWHHLREGSDALTPVQPVWDD